ncbi:hypothetical protein [Persephonella sp.]|uniref:hypothetical protein n=1 Tax=Persephonella sp. TaxID=2060922 RepID=UPI0026334195|nr:hypothetical protein [Persephonella sp.]
MYQNFLEELIYEYLDFKGCFVKRNIKLRKREKGGFDREIDILALDTRNCIVYHIETSFATNKSWDQTIENFKRKKFDIKKKEYAQLVGLEAHEIQIVKVAILLNVPKQKEKRDLFEKETKSKLYSIKEIMEEIKSPITSKDPLKEAIPEKYPLLRTIQFIHHFTESNN